ncbi:hypothetical protein ISN44_As07g004650 [Arabidopsis suecica]|uniref:DUF1985 domain-containing protein n=1 Tax=Arabidopsis suecica TaxID=45249 RepID=A0A8T2BQV2_ARASU|nr:hypothetical protein ISN44_As08g004260 [Arabidopsis suecica]KAG7588113.1 hypothetical protein ISN44_As07g004650 [Arabidopsis suecica]
MARVKGRDNRVYESTEGSPEGAANPDPTKASTDASVPTEASTDAAVPKDAPTDAASPTEAPMDAAVLPTEEPTDAAVIVPTVESAEVTTEELEVSSVPELSDKEEKEEASESKEEEVGEHDKEVCELSIDGQGCDNEEEERVSDAEGEDVAGDNEEEDVAGVVKNIVDDIAAEEEEEERVNDVAADTDEDDDDEESQPLPPESMYFSPTEYNKVCKVGSRCKVGQTVANIEAFDEEVSWFRNHDQFKHIFHMPKEPNHMIQGMWMLMLRTARTDMENECWFVVNGVPIRYSLKEHALLTGLDCHEYPKNHEKKGSLRIVRRMFGRTDLIKIKDVEKKLAAIKSEKCLDRKKLIILLFLCAVVKADSKGDGNIEKFLLRIVDDVHACETFPWGRYSFEQCMTGIRRMMKNMKGSVKPKAQSSFFGFITPLEIFAFECIPQLGRRFREAVPAANDCPRMCKSKFTDSCMKGFTLDEINQALGEIKDISSILEPDMDEKEMLSGLVEKDVDEGMGFIDPVVEGWREQLIRKKKKIWWKSLYQMDLQARGFGDVVPEVAERLGDVKESDGEVPERLGDILSLQSAVDKGFAKIMEKLSEMDSKVSMLDGRVKDLEGYVSVQRGKERYNEYHPGTSSDFVPTYCTPTANQPIASPTKALVLHSGFTDPKPIQIQELSDEGDQEQLARKEKENKKKKAVRPKHSGPTIQTGKKRQRKASRFQAEEFTAEGKGKGKKRQKK